MLFVLGCVSSEKKFRIEEENTISNHWNFDTLDGWEDGSQNMNGVVNYKTTDGVLRIYTNKGTADRPKVRTKDQIYGYGKYIWKVFVPEMGVGDKASIGAFLYNDDAHELDFEIGYGKAALRAELNAQEDDLVAWMTTQKNPAQSIKKTIKRNKWYTLEIALKNQNNSYYATWSIDNVVVAEADLKYGGETLFKIFCSVENLGFMGDHVATQENYALFDYVEYQEQF